MHSISPLSKSLQNPDPHKTMPRFSFLRWIGKLTRTRIQIHDNHRKTEHNDPISNSFECHACTEVGVPGFHSTSCDGTHQPEWEALAGSSSIPILSRKKNPNRTRNSSGPFGRVLDPRSQMVQRWNRVLLLARCVSLAVDPLFFYGLTLIVSGESGAQCLTLDGGFATAVTAIRTCVDAFHMWHVWLQFKLAYVSRESLVVGCGKLVWDARAVAFHYINSLKGFWLDLFVILPIPQAVFWLLVPELLLKEQIKLVMALLLFLFLFQYLPKIYHSICLMRSMRKVTGYIFGSIWWGFGINLIAYLIASHVIGGCWYLLSTARVISCLQLQCQRNRDCNASFSCLRRDFHQFPSSPGVVNSTVLRKSLCLEANGPFQYGIYDTALPVICSDSLAVRTLFPIYWGLINLNSFGNVLEPSSNLSEVIFSICIVLCGLMLFTLLVGNIQVFLQVVMAKREQFQLRHQDIEWWMRRRQLPSRLRRRVRHFEHQKWETMGGDEELQWIDELPEGLRRDIKRHLCLDLIKKVPLFLSLDDLILDNICDRVKPLIFSKNEKLIREGDPVQRMVFIISGRVKRCQGLSKGRVATSILEPGSFLGDELLSWSLCRPFTTRLPASSATFTCIESVEAFGLDANDLRYITDHFKYRFASGALKRTARYYSSNWRTWAAVIIQLAWRRYWVRTRGNLVVTENGGSDNRLRKYAAMFLSVRPHDHLQ